MSIHSSSIKRLTAPDILARKGATPIVCLTAYSATMARLVDAHADFVLVGDSLGMVEHGLPSTLGVTVDMMVLHGASVVRGSRSALVVVDLPFGSYEGSVEQAFATASRIMADTGCGAVKLEGGAAMAPTIRHLMERGIPVCAHIGLTPQAVNALGGFRSQGHETDARDKILADALAVEEAGAFAIVVEGVVEPLAEEITRRAAVPTIGIGAAAACDGQILVLEDMLGLSPRVPRFVKRFAEIGTTIDAAIEAYAEAVRTRTFPGPENVYKPRD